METTRLLTVRYFGHSFETGSFECDFDAAEDFDDVYCRNVNGVCVFPEIESGQKHLVMRGWQKTIFLPNHLI